MDNLPIWSYPKNISDNITSTNRIIKQPNMVREQSIIFLFKVICRVQ